jgi:hypothetical protein
MRHAEVAWEESRARSMSVMLPPDYIAEFIHENYIEPARRRGDKAVTIQPREVYKALDCGCSLSLIHGVIGSMKFRNTYRLTLARTEGPEDGLPTKYTFKLVLAASASSASARA